MADLDATAATRLVVHAARRLAEQIRGLGGQRWDVARPVFEASPAGRRYSPADGVTHAVIQRAAGLWVRHALVGWNARHPEPEHLLIGKTPFVCNRFVELARRVDDRAEALPAAPSCRLVVAVPSGEDRRFLESERVRLATSPLHPRKREDAPPSRLSDLWRDLVDVARGLAITATGAGYDPFVYRRIYEMILRDRHGTAASLPST